MKFENKAVKVKYKTFAIFIKFSDIERSAISVCKVWQTQSLNSYLIFKYEIKIERHDRKFFAWTQSINESSEYLSISKFHSRITKESCKIV